MVNHGMKLLVQKGFNDLHAEGKLNLKLVKRNALVDFISSLPHILSIAATPPNIKHGFVQNGMADKIRHEFPDYDALLATCRMNPEVADYELTEKSFPLLIQQQFDEGHIPDTMLEELGFPKDKDMDGNEVRREATITQEARQRAKCHTQAPSGIAQRIGCEACCCRNAKGSTKCKQDPESS